MPDPSRADAERRPPAPAPGLADALLALQHDDPDGLVVFDAEWRYAYVNPAAARLGGLALPDVLGAAADAVTPGIWATPFGAALRAARDEGRAADLAAVRAPSGRVYDVRLTPTAVGVAVRFRDVGAREAAAAALRASEGRHRTLVEAAPDAIVLHRGGRLLYVNPAGLALFGVDDPAAVLGRPLGDLLAPDAPAAAAPDEPPAGAPAGAPRAVPNEPACAAPARGPAGAYVVRRPDGSARHVEATSVAIPHDGGPAVQTLLHDVTARLAAERALGEQHALLRAVLEGTVDAVWVTNPDGTFRLINAAGAAALGRPADAVVGQPPEAVFAPDDAAAVRARNARVFASGEACTEEASAVMADGRARTWMTTRAPLRDPLGRVAGVIGVARDVSERRALEAQLRHQAEHDALTGLANRARFRDRVDRALGHAARGARAAVLYLDLDGFKEVNDTLGHAAGDRLLTHVARRLAAATRDGDTVARLGGDEFAVLLERLDGDDDARRVVARILDALARPVPPGDGGGAAVTPAASVGLAFVTPGATVDEVLRHADLAMYQAKAAGKGRSAVYDPALHAAAAARAELAADLAGAPARGELHLAYQPIVELATGRVAGVEALARWRHPRRGPVAPAVFIPLAEDTGAIGAVGRFVLECACRQLAAWRAAGRLAGVGEAALPWLSVNVSARQLDDDAFAAEVAAVLRATGVPPGQLTLELSEGTLMRRTAGGARRVRALKALGVRLGVDDFGTGYSSLGRLQRLPADVLKLDRTFVAGVAADPGAAEVARMVLALGGALGLRTVAEGVETPAQYARLLALGCALGQGHLFAPPVDARAVEELLWGDAPLPTWDARAPAPADGG